MNFHMSCPDCNETLLQCIGATNGFIKKHVEAGKLGPSFECDCGSIFNLSFDEAGQASMEKDLKLSKVRKRK